MQNLCEHDGSLLRQPCTRCLRNSLTAQRYGCYECSQVGDNTPGILSGGELFYPVHLHGDIYRKCTGGPQLSRDVSRFPNQMVHFIQPQDFVYWDETFRSCDPDGKKFFHPTDGRCTIFDSNNGYYDNGDFWLDPHDDGTRDGHPGTSMKAKCAPMLLWASRPQMDKDGKPTGAHYVDNYRAKAWMEHHNIKSLRKLCPMIQFALYCNYIRMADHLYQCPAMVRIVEDMVGFEEPCGVDEIASNSGTVPTMGYAFRPIRSGDWQSPNQMREHSICKTSEGGPAYQHPGLACLVWYRYLELKHLARESQFNADTSLTDRNSTIPQLFSAVPKAVNSKLTIPVALEFDSNFRQGPLYQAPPTVDGKEKTVTWYDEVSQLNISESGYGVPPESPLRGADSGRWNTGGTELTSDVMKEITRIVAKHRAALYWNSHGSSVSSSATEEEVAASHTAQVFHTADAENDADRFYEYPGENFDDAMWTAHHTAGTVFSRTSILDPEQDDQDEIDELLDPMDFAAPDPYHTVDPELPSVATGCFGDWATWSASPEFQRTGWIDERNGGVWTEG